MRIIVAAAGSRGDVQPMLLLADALAGRGHDVVLCGPPNFRDRAQEMGLNFVSGSTDLQAYFGRFSDTTSSLFRFLQRGLVLLAAEVDLQFDALEPLTEGADALVGGGVAFAAKSIAAWRGIPYLPVAYVPIILFSPEHAPPVFPWNNLPRWVNRALWEVADALLLGAMGRRINARRRALGLRPVLRLFRSFADGDILLAADPQIVAAPSDLADHTAITGAFVQGADARLPEYLEAFLQAGPPPVYIGFGSMPDPRPDRLRDLFVEALALAGARGILLRGWSSLDDAGLPATVRLVGDVSHAALLPRMAAVVHHGGAGTTAAAARSGVPQIIVPHIADQFYFGRRMSELGACAGVIPRRKLRAERLAAAIRRAVEEPALRASARALAASLSGDGLAVAVARIEAVAMRGGAASTPC